MNNILKKITVFLIGLLVILFIIEIILRLIGFIGQEEAGTGISDNDNESNYTIMCVGDSFTRGIGAPSGNDYPLYLQKLFNEKQDKIVKVLNTSVAGKNSSQIMNTLPDEIKKARPDMLILLMGGANHWNFWGYKSSLDLPGQSMPGAGFLENLRVYKLIRLLTSNVEDKMESDNRESRSVHLEEERYNEAIKKFNIAVGKNPNDGSAFYDMGAFYMYERNTEKASEWFGKGIDANPLFPDNYLGMGAVYRELGDDEGRKKWYLKGMENAKGKNKEKIYALTLLDYLQGRKYEMAMPMLEKAIGEFPNCADFYKMLKTMKDDYPSGTVKIGEILANEPPRENQSFIKLGDVNFNDVPNDNPQLESDNALIMKWIRMDYIKAIELCRELGIKLIIQNYPLRGRDWNTFSMAYKKANEVIERVTKEYSVPFVNNFGIFASQGRGVDRYLEAPGSAEHCSVAGYRLMAENIYKLFSSMKIIYRENITESAATSPEGITDKAPGTLEKEGDELLEKEEFEAALAKYSKAIEVKPGSMLYLKSGDIKALMRKTDDAMADFEKAIEQDPENAMAYNSMGRVYFDKGEYEKSLDNYNKAIKINPGLIDAYNNRGYLKSEMEDYKGAIIDYDILLKYSPKHALALNNRGFARYKLKDFARALEDISLSLSLLADNSYAYKNKALVNIALKRFEAAIVDLKKAKELGFARDYGDEADKLMDGVRKKLN